MRRANPTPARAGFTLIELLVVMAIIAALSALVLSAVFTVRESQMKSFTETLVQKLASALDQHWKAAVDQIREEPVPATFLTLAGGDVQRAKVMYLKARLVQEFPVTFNQAKAPMGVPPVYLAAKPAYANLPTTNASNQSYESSALLYLALSQGRRGLTGFNPDEHVEATAIQTRGNLKIFVDSWGNPLRYYAFPYYNTELNGPPYYDSSRVQNQQSPDPLDPDRKLLNYSNATFAQYIHPLDPQLGLRYMIPVVASAGRDGDFGDDTKNPILGQVYMRLVTYDASNNAIPNPAAYDNIYSYRLRRVGQRGD